MSRPSKSTKIGGDDLCPCILRHRLAPSPSSAAAGLPSTPGRVGEEEHGTAKGSGELESV